MAAEILSHPRSLLQSLGVPKLLFCYLRSIFVSSKLRLAQSHETYTNSFIIMFSKYSGRIGPVFYINEGQLGPAVMQKGFVFNLQVISECGHS